jgi:hypothetical protein
MRHLQRQNMQPSEMGSGKEALSGVAYLATSSRKEFQRRQAADMKRQATVVHLCQKRKEKTSHGYSKQITSTPP